ncbi:MAG: AAA family ATPase [Phycisphaerae bacterium]|jgi:dephospho-CoA kinase|nr:AAA family ATPase [Phycisphaerae bacterium]
MKIIGIIGKNGAGKDELADYLHQTHGLAVLSLGDLVREIAANENIIPTRNNLMDISAHYLTLRGKGYFIQKIIEKIERKKWDMTAILGIRTLNDVQTLRECFGKDFILVHVQTLDQEKRYERAKSRNELCDPQTYIDFLSYEEAEESQFGISVTAEQADLVIEFDGTQEAFHEKIEQLLVQPFLSETMVRY